MAHEIRGRRAVRILSREDIIKEFADANNPIPIQILSGLGYILNSGDDFVIRKEYKELGDTAGGAMLRKCLIQRYSDQPEKFTLKQLIDVFANFNTNVKLKELLVSASLESDICPKLPVSNFDSGLVQDIKAYLQLMCENVRQVWGKLINETSLEKCFVEPEIIEEEMGEDGKRRRKDTGKSVNSYEQLFETQTLGDRIIIEGDPGMGKTTYVNKLALDWTWDKGSEHFSDNTLFLQSKFVSIFLIPLRSLNGGRAATLTQAASLQIENCGPWLDQKYRSNPNESLLILDAFDEYDGSCPGINEIIQGTRFPRLKVIITTRPSNLDKLNIKNQWLSISGLTTPEKREQFLVNQKLTLINDVLPNFGTLWHNPLYLTMLCVLYKAKKVTGFDPRKPDCFYVLVKLFTDHIISRKAKEGSKLKREEREKVKLYIQKFAMEEFSKSNPWITNVLTVEKNIFQWFTGALKTPFSAKSVTEDLSNVAGKLGLITIRVEQSPVTGESEEILSFVHQLFLEFYAAVEFGSIFSTLSDEQRKNLLKMVDISNSPFSYFLAAECKEYQEMLIKEQTKKCKVEKTFFHIFVNLFPWLPEVQISDYILLKNFGAPQLFIFSCDFRNFKSSWDLEYVNKLCSIAKPKKVHIQHAEIDHQDESLDQILSSVNELTLFSCSCQCSNLEKQYQNLTNFKFTCRSMQKSPGGTMLLQNFPNLLKLKLETNIITDETINLLCNSLQNMHQLRKLALYECFKSVQHVIRLAKTIGTSSLCQSLVEMELHKNILDSETESSSDILLRAISKCVQLKVLDLSDCVIKAQILDTMKVILQNTPYLRNNLQILDINGVIFVPPNMITNEDMEKFESDIEAICAPHLLAINV